MQARNSHGESERRSALRARIVATAVIVLLTAAILAAVVAQWPAASAALPSALFSNGAVAVAGGHSAVLGARGMVPGGVATGELAIANKGTAAGRFWLGTSSLVDRPGPGGGSLARALQLVVTDVSVPLAPREVYRGALADLSATDLGTFSPGEVRTFELRITFPQAAASGYDFAASSLSVAFDWTAVSG